VTIFRRNSSERGEIDRNQLLLPLSLCLSRSPLLANTGLGATRENERVKVHVWRLARRTIAGHFRRLRDEPVDLLSTAARGTTVLWLGYSYEDVIGPVDSFRVAHLTCDMIQKRRVVVTSSIGSSVRAISVPRPTRIASPLSSSSARQRDQHFVACCSLFATSGLIRQPSPFFPQCTRAISRAIRTRRGRGTPTISNIRKNWAPATLRRAFQTFDRRSASSMKTSCDRLCRSDKQEYSV